MHFSFSKGVETGHKVQEIWQMFKETLNSKEEETSSKSKSSYSENYKQKNFYRCHRRGQFAETCSVKQVLKEISLENKTELSKMSDSLI